MRRIYIAALALATLAACGTGGGGTGAGTQAAPAAKVMIETHEFKFGVAGEPIPAGLVELTHHNKGKQAHQIQIFRLNEGVAFEDFRKTVTKDKSGLETLGLGEPAGGTTEVMPGEDLTVWVDLEEGSYAIVCFLQGHHTKGMVQPLEVGPAEADEFEEPTAEAEIGATEFGFAVPDGFTGGLVEFINNGKQPHEAGLFRLDTSLAKVQAFLKDPKGPPPGGEPQGAGMAAAIAPGTSMYSDLGQLEPGVYAFVCFIPDPEKKQPHFNLGMHHAFEVK